MKNVPKIESRQYSILIVSSSEQFTAIIKNSLSERRFTAIVTRTGAAAARRTVFDRDFDLVVICVPLPDETGIELALDIAERSNAGVMVVVPSEIYASALERVTDSGILTVSRPTTKLVLSTAVRLLVSLQDKMQALVMKEQAAREKTEEVRIVDRAKFALMEQKHMTEDDAHRYVGKLAMDNGISRRKAAERILDDLE